MTGYAGEIPDGASSFEDKFGLIPLGNDVELRLERLETILGIVLDASLHPDRGMHAEVGILRKLVEVSSPTPFDADTALNKYRTPDERHAQMLRRHDEQ